MEKRRGCYGVKWGAMRLGAISFNRSTHLPPSAGSGLAKPVMLPLGCAMLAAKPPPNRIGNKRKHNRDSPRLASKGADHGVVTPKIASGRVLTSSFAKVPILAASLSPQRSSIWRLPPLPKRILKRYKPRLCCQIASRRANQSSVAARPAVCARQAATPRLTQRLF